MMTYYTTADDLEDTLQMLMQQEDGTWLRRDDVTMSQVKNKDIVTVSMDNHFRR